MRHHLVKQLQSVTRREILHRKRLIRQVVQVVLCQIGTGEEVLIGINLRLVVNKLGKGDSAQ